MNLSSMFTVAITASSKALSELGVTVPANVVRIVLYPAAGTVNWNLDAAASGSTNTLPSSGMSFPMVQGTANKLRFFSTSGATLDGYFVTGMVGQQGGASL